MTSMEYISFFNHAGRGNSVPLTEDVKLRVISTNRAIAAIYTVSIVSFKGPWFSNKCCLAGYIARTQKRIMVKYTSHHDASRLSQSGLVGLPVKRDDTNSGPGTA